MDSAGCPCEPIAHISPQVSLPGHAMLRLTASHIKFGFRRSQKALTLRWSKKTCFPIPLATPTCPLTPDATCVGFSSTQSTVNRWPKI